MPGPTPFSPADIPATGNFTGQECDFLRTVMGMPHVFRSSNPVFESVLTTINGLGVADPVDAGATQAAIRVLEANILTVDAQILANSALMLGNEITGEVKYDAVRNDAALREVGRAYIHQLAVRFSMNPQEDYYGPPELQIGVADMKMHRVYD